MVERRGPIVVCEAIQLSLGRRVALRVLDRRAAADPGAAERFRRRAARWAAWQHPHAVPVYELADSARGPLIATRLQRGASLESLLAAGSLTREGALEIGRQVAAALDSAHASGLVHGAVGAASIRVDGGSAALDCPSDTWHPPAPGGCREGDLRDFRALLERAGLGPCPRAAGAGDTSSASDLVDRAVGARGPGRGGTLRRRGAAAGVAALAAAIALVAGTLGGGGRAGPAPDRPAPPPGPGAEALGGDVGPGELRTARCGDTGAPSRCTVAQVRLRGRPAAVPARGVIAGWSVRGAEGWLRLQVVRPRAGGRFVRAVQSQWRRAGDRGPHRFATDLPVRPGDLIAVQLLPGAAIGARPAAGAATRRWIGPLASKPRSPAPDRGSDRGTELALRVDHVPGGRRDPVRPLRGRAAAAAPAGGELGSIQVELRSGPVVRATVARLPGRIALDAFRGRRRIARIDVPGADPDGSLRDLELGVPGGDLRVSWANPDVEVAVEHRYRLLPDSIRLID